MTNFEYPTLTEQDRKAFTEFLVKAGYSEQYASAVPSYHYEGRGKHSCVSRAQTLFRAWLEENPSACSPYGLRDVREDDVIEADKDTFEASEEEPTGQPTISLVAPLAKKWDLIVHICISDATDDLKESLIRKILE